MDHHEPGRMFRGSELRSLLVLLAIALGGWAAVWYYFAYDRGDAPEPEVVVSGTPTPIEPDRSAEFETVTDKTPLSFRDTAAYEKLLAESRAATPAGLAREARRDVTYAHLWQNPAHYRGVPLHLIGNARRVLRYESRLSKTGWLYEAWVAVLDLPKNPYVCVFEDAPNGLPVGPDVSERVVFNGYFLKLMRYQAGDTERGAPLLVGRIGWTPHPVPAGSPNRPAYWLAGAVAMMFCISLARWVLHLRRSLGPRPRPSLLRDRPSDEIDPEALASFLQNVDKNGDGPEPPADSR
jgi:hypothetical protein